MTLKISSIQQMLAETVANEIGNATGAPIRVGTIAVSHIDEIALNDIVIQDLDGDTALVAEKVTAHISPYLLLKNRIQINTLTVASPDIRLYKKEKDSPLNIQFIIDKLKGNDEKEDKPFALSINQLLIYDGRFRFDIQNAPFKEGVLDPSHIDINDIRCNISLRELHKEKLDLLVRSVGGVEKSGLEIEKFKARLKSSDNTIRVSGMEISFPNSSLVSDSISMVFDKNNAKATSITGDIRSPRTNLSDFTALYPGFSQEIPEISFSLYNHTDSTLSRTELTASAAEGNVSLKSIATIETPYDNDRKINLYVRDLDLTQRGINGIVPLFTKDGKKIAGKIGDFSLTGEAEMTQNRLKGIATIETINGSISAAATIDDKGNFRIKTNGSDINISELADIKEALSCSLDAKATGNISKEAKSIEFEGKVIDLQTGRYTFMPIDFDGTYNSNGNIIRADIATDDPGLQARVSLDYSNLNEHRATLSLDVDTINPQKIGLNDKKDETFSFRLDGEFNMHDDGRRLLNLKLNDFTYFDSEKNNVIHNLHFCDTRTKEQRLTMVNSDFINCSVIGEFGYRSLLNSLYSMTAKHAPSLFTNIDTTATGNNYIFTCDIKDSRFVSRLLKLPVVINSPSSIKGACNDRIGALAVETKLNGIELKKSKIKSIEINGRSNNDALTLETRIVKPTKPSSDGTPNKDLEIELNCNLADDILKNTLSWNNNKTKRQTKGKLRMEAMLSRDADEELFVKALMQNDSIVHNDSVWYLSGGGISGNRKKINIDGIYLYNDSQHLRLDGIAGKEKEDTLSVSAHNLEVSTILDLIRFKILKFNGNATGKAYATSLLSAPDASGSFKVDSFKIDDAYLGNADLNIGWENLRKAIVLGADIHNDDGKTSSVNGFLSQANDTIHLDIEADELNAAFINKMVRSFMSDIRGTGSGNVSLLGKWRAIDMTGAVALNCSARINPTNVRYTFHGDSVYFTSGKLSFHEALATDWRGNKGWLSGEVTHKNMGKWACNLSAKAEELLVYNTHNFDEAPFYGTIFATGDATLKANENGLFLEATANNSPGSRLIYDSSSTGNASDNSFITFTDSSKKQPGKSGDDEEDKEYKNVESKLNLNFTLDLDEGMLTRVYTNLKSDDYLDLYGKGTINAIYDEKDGFSLKGNMDLDRGVYKITVQDIFTKEFNIIKGSTLQFNGDPYEAVLDLKTKYLVPSASLSALTAEATNHKSVKVNCLLNITGTLESPVLNFDLELPEGSEEEKEMLASATSTPEQKNTQFIYLLGIGKFYTYNYNNPLATNTQNTTAVESLISNTLSGQLNNMLGQIIDNDNWNISGNISTSERGWNSMEVEGMLEGRLLNDRLLINGNLGYRENPIANRNFIGDFELQWLLNRTGTVSLKAYSKTNDRYFSKTNLTTQGAGIILRHDFNYWRWWKKSKEDEKKEKENEDK